jgi:hypothetical protein
MDEIYQGRIEEKQERYTYKKRNDLLGHSKIFFIPIKQG